MSYKCDSKNYETKTIFQSNSENYQKRFWVIHNINLRLDTTSRPRQYVPGLYHKPFFLRQHSCFSCISLHFCRLRARKNFHNGFPIALEIHWNFCSLEFFVPLQTYSKYFLLCRFCSFLVGGVEELEITFACCTTLSNILQKPFCEINQWCRDEKFITHKHSAGSINWGSEWKSRSWEMYMVEGFKAAKFSSQQHKALIMLHILSNFLCEPVGCPLASHQNEKQERNSE